MKWLRDSWWNDKDNWWGRRKNRWQQRQERHGYLDLYSDVYTCFFLAPNSMRSNQQVMTEGHGELKQQKYLSHNFESDDWSSRACQSGQNVKCERDRDSTCRGQQAFFSFFLFLILSGKAMAQSCIVNRTDAEIWDGTSFDVIPGLLYIIWAFPFIFHFTWLVLNGYNPPRQRLSCILFLLWFSDWVLLSLKHPWPKPNYHILKSYPSRGLIGSCLVPIRSHTFWDKTLWVRLSSLMHPMPVVCEHLWSHTSPKTCGV